MSTPTPPATASSVQALTVATLAKSLTHRIQRMHLFRAPTSAPIPEEITALKGGQVELVELDEDDGWEDMGLIGSEDAPTWEQDSDTTDLMAIGFNNAVRSDRTSQTDTLAATFLEWKRPVLEVYENIDMRGITPDPQTGELRWVRGNDTPLIESRYAAYGQDGVGSDRVWIVRFLPAGVVESVESQQWGGESFATFGATLRGNVDTEYDTSLITCLGGPGIKKHVAAMGFAA